MKTITLTGPESTGKTSLCQDLAAYYSCQYISEYARTYLDQYGAHYDSSDLLKIAAHQTQLIQEARRSSKDQDYLFVDTDALTVKIWAEKKLNFKDSAFEQMIQDAQPDLYLLCYPDTIWSPDPLREDEKNRHELFVDYEHEIINLNVQYMIVTGQGKSRLHSILNHLNNIK